MLKKTFEYILAIIFAALMIAAFASASEIESKKELTPRQMLLLQIPRDYVLSLTITDMQQNPPQVIGLARWSVMQSQDAPGGPFEIIQFILENRIETYLTVGAQLEEVIWKGYESEEDYMLVGKFKNNLLEIIFNASGKTLSEAENTKISENMAKWIKIVLTKLEILTDADLAEYIKDQKFKSKKAAPL